MTVDKIMLSVILLLFLASLVLRKNITIKKYFPELKVLCTRLLNPKVGYESQQEIKFTTTRLCTFLVFVHALVYLLYKVIGD